MLRCEDVGSVRSRRFAGLSDSTPVLLLTRPPIDTGLCLRSDLEDQGLLPLPVVGRFHRGCGPAERRSPIEKDRRGDALSSKCAMGVGKGEDAVLCATLRPEATSTFSCSLISSPTTTASTRISSLADTNVGVYFRSAYTRRIGFGMPVEPRCFDTERSSEWIPGEKYDRKWASCVSFSLPSSVMRLLLSELGSLSCSVTERW